MEKLTEDVYLGDDIANLVLAYYESDMEKLTLNAISKVFEHDEIIKNLSKLQQLHLKMALVDVLLDSNNTALLMGFDEGFNTAFDVIRKLNQDND